MRANWNLLLVVLGSLMVLVEVALGGFAGFDLVLIGSCLIAGGGLGLLFGNTMLGLMLAGVLAVLYIAAGRKWVRSRTQLSNSPSNVDALIGQKGRVTQRIAPHEPGQVKVRDEVWRAVAAADANGPIESGAEITVLGVDGVTLKVR